MGHSLLEMEYTHHKCHRTVRRPPARLLGVTTSLLGCRTSPFDCCYVEDNKEGEGFRILGDCFLKFLNMKGFVRMKTMNSTCKVESGK